MITAVLIDDEPNSLEALKIKIEKVSDNIKILFSFVSPMEALHQLPKADFDLLFLDIEMPGMDGFAFLEKIENRNFEVIITTAHNEYAVNAIRHSAVDFLQKPIDIDELKLAINRVESKIAAKKTNNIGNLTKLNANFDKIPVPSLRGINFVPIIDILYMESEGNYTTIHLENSQNIVSSRNLGDYETMLKQAGFYRIHNSTLININHIKEYIRGDGGSIILKNGDELDVSKRRKKEFLELLGYGQ